jgi:hypothetical protein
MPLLRDPDFGRRSLALAGMLMESRQRKAFHGHRTHWGESDGLVVENIVMSKKLGLSLAGALLLTGTLLVPAAHAGTRSPAAAAPSLLQLGWGFVTALFGTPTPQDSKHSCKIDPLGNLVCSAGATVPDKHSCKIDPLGQLICNP